MNIDELKTAWKEYDRKIESTREINERMLHSMISERSGSRFEGVKRRYRASMLWILICLTFSVLVITTNPFDYRYMFQYIPMAIFGVTLSVLFVDLARSYFTFQKITLTQYNVGESLKRIIAVYEKPRRFMRYLVIVFLFSQIVLFPLSFLPDNIEQAELLPALSGRLIPIGIGALLLFIAVWLDMFKDTHAARFRDDLNELMSLKKMSTELRE